MSLIWRIPENYPEDWIAHYIAKESPDRFLLRNGQPWPDFEKTPTVRVNASLSSLQSFDILPNSTGDPLVSQNVLDKLEVLCHHDFEAIPARVLAEDGELKERYFLNILSRDSIIDMHQSQYMCVPGTERIMKFRKLRLLEQESEKKFHLVRDNFYASYLFISCEVRDLLLEESWKYYKLCFPDEIGP